MTRPRGGARRPLPRAQPLARAAGGAPLTPASLARGRGATSTSRSSAPASRGCGRPTTSRRASPTARRRDRARDRGLRAVRAQRRLGGRRARRQPAGLGIAHDRRDASASTARDLRRPSMRSAQSRRASRSSAAIARQAASPSPPATRSGQRLRLARRPIAASQEADGHLLIAAEVADARRGRRRFTADGSRRTPHAIDPARLVRGLAAACERHGVTIYERTDATATRARARALRGGQRSRRRSCCGATESYTTQLPGRARATCRSTR